MESIMAENIFAKRTPQPPGCKVVFNRGDDM
jgi:hypothetical protein